MFFIRKREKLDFGTFRPDVGLVNYYYGEFTLVLVCFDGARWISQFERS